MKLIKLEKSLQKIQRHLENMKQDNTALSTLDVDYLKKMTINFYELLDDELINEEGKDNMASFVTESQEEKVTDHLPSEIFDEEVEVEPAPIVKAETVHAQMAKPVQNTTTAVDELFAVPAGQELSDILSNRPIEHISASMGFNERIFTINELFGGDKEFFDQMVNELNNLQDLNEAKALLNDKVIGQYDWISEARIKNAQTFIRHIQRRYQAVPVQ